MATTLTRLDQAAVSEIATTIRNAGVAGAGGAGFPAYAKWERLDEADYLLVNHQESEPNYFMDRWLGRERAEHLATLFDALLDRAFDAVVVGAKRRDREEWMLELERITDGAVYQPEELPLDPGDEDGVVFAYTEDRYEYGMESVLLRMVADVVVGSDLPMDHGWIVQNTESLYNVYRALDGGDPVTHKYVHVDGHVPRHRFLKVPVGTPASTLLAAAGRSAGGLADDRMVADGGPGWCFEIRRSPAEFGVRKRTNCVLVLDAELAAENTLGDDRINVLGERDWKDARAETEPTATLSPEYVRVPLLSNPAFEGVVAPSDPIVSPGDDVSVGEMIARPASGGISNAQHASIDGEVTTVTDAHVEIWSHDATGAEAVREPDRSIYWTWCVECGSYVVYPDAAGRSVGAAGRSDPTYYVCEDCR